MKETIAAMKKILGADADIPTQPVDFESLKARDAANHTKAKHHSAELEKILVAGENIALTYVNGLEKFKSAVMGSDLGLDKTDSEDAKKIAAAKKVFMDKYAANKQYADKLQQSYDAILKNLA